MIDNLAGGEVIDPVVEIIKIKFVFQSPNNRIYGVEGSTTYYAKIAFYHFPNLTRILSMVNYCSLDSVVWTVQVRLCWLDMCKV